MKTIFIFLTTGFEEIEAVATVDILRRAGLNAQTVSLEQGRIVVGSHHIPVTANLLFDEVIFSTAEMLVLPGGTTRYNEHEGLKKEIKAFLAEGKKVSAICASPLVLGQMGELKGKRATCYPGFEQYLDGAMLETEKAVVQDGNIITGRGPGLTIDFALKIVEVVAGKAKRDEIARQLLVQ